MRTKPPRSGRNFKIEILITGPADSGKTTAARSILKFFKEEFDLDLIAEDTTYGEVIKNETKKTKTDPH